MKAAFLDPRVTLYVLPDLTSLPMAELTEGQELEVVDTATDAGQTWLIIALADGRRGYLPGDRTLFRFRKARLAYDTDVHVEPSLLSPVLGHYPGGSVLLIIGEPVLAGQTWIRLRDADGREGFVPKGADLEDPTKPSRARLVEAAGKRNVIIGGACFVGGSIITVVTYAGASGGGTYVVAWGAIIFGGIQFVKGLGQLFG